MTFGEKVRNARRARGLSQDALAGQLGVSRRTVTSWETDRSFPRTRGGYEALAGALGVPVNELLVEDGTSSLMETGAQYGDRGKKSAEKLVSELTGLFAGGEMAEEDMDALMLAVQQAYVDAKKKNRKYTPKKYREDPDA